MISDKSPCYFCENRSLECHANCEKYSQWAKARAAKKKEYYIQKGIDNIADAYRSATRAKMKKRKNSGGK